MVKFLPTLYITIVYVTRRLPARIHMRHFANFVARQTAAASASCAWRPWMTGMDLPSLQLQSWSRLSLEWRGGGITFHAFLLLWPWPWPWPDNLRMRTWACIPETIYRPKMDFLDQGFRKLEHY